MELLALSVLNGRDPSCVVIVEPLLYIDGHRIGVVDRALLLQVLKGEVTALAEDDSVDAITLRSHDQVLQNAVDADTLRQTGDRSLVDDLAGIYLRRPERR